MTVQSDRQVERYLSELDDALRGLPGPRRAELVAEIRAHIDSALAGREHSIAADVDRVLDELGDPTAIAAAAMDREPMDDSPRPSRLLEISAVVLLLVGGFLLPLVGWVIGVVLLWASRAWSTRDKLLATLIVPGGLLPAFLLLFGVLPGTGYSSSCGTSSSPGQPSVTICQGHGPSTLQVMVAIAVLIVVVLGPIAMAIRLLRRLR